MTGNDLEEREALREYLGKEFETKELGTVKYFLRIEVAHSKCRIFVFQQKYVLDLLQKTRRDASQLTHLLIRTTSSEKQVRT